jgi:hypothetical protein
MSLFGSGFAAIETIEFSCPLDVTGKIEELKAGWLWLVSL